MCLKTGAHIDRGQGGPVYIPICAVKRQLPRSLEGASPVCAWKTNRGGTLECSSPERPYTCLEDVTEEAERMSASGCSRLYVHCQANSIKT